MTLGLTPYLAKVALAQRPMSAKQIFQALPVPVFPAHSRLTLTLALQHLTNCATILLPLVPLQARLACKHILTPALKALAMRPAP